MALLLLPRLPLLPKSAHVWCQAAASSSRRGAAIQRWSLPEERQHSQQVPPLAALAGVRVRGSCGCCLQLRQQGPPALHPLQLNFQHAQWRHQQLLLGLLHAVAANQVAT